MNRIVTAILMLLPFSLLAAEPADVKLAIVDFQKALNSVEEGKVAKTRLEKEAKEKEKALEKKKAELDKLQDEYKAFQAQAALMKPEAAEQKRQKLETDLTEKSQAYVALYQSTQKEFAEKEQKATADIINRLHELVNELGRKDGYAMVFEKNSGLIYAAVSTDITEKLIQTYNAKYKGGK